MPCLVIIKPNVKNSIMPVLLLLLHITPAILPSHAPLTESLPSACRHAVNSPNLKINTNSLFANSPFQLWPHFLPLQQNSRLAHMFCLQSLSSMLFVPPHSDFTHHDCHMLTEWPYPQLRLPWKVFFTQHPSHHSLVFLPLRWGNLICSFPHSPTSTPWACPRVPSGDLSTLTAIVRSSGLVALNTIHLRFLFEIDESHISVSPCTSPLNSSLFV